MQEKFFAKTMDFQGFSSLFHPSPKRAFDFFFMKKEPDTISCVWLFYTIKMQLLC